MLVRFSPTPNKESATLGVSHGDQKPFRPWLQDWPVGLETSWDIFHSQNFGDGTGRFISPSVETLVLSQTSAEFGR
jgi:hypothetical protein